MLAGLHLFMLVCFDNNHTYAKVELLTYLGPLLLLLGDTLLNRIYMPAGIMAYYLFATYATCTIYKGDMAPSFAQTSPLPEF